MAVGLLIVFLLGFSFATGALEAGPWQNSRWHLSAVDTRGQRRVQLIVGWVELPSLNVYDASGRPLQSQ